jgi:hypothetical protein
VSRGEIASNLKVNGSKFSPCEEISRRVSSSSALMKRPKGYYYLLSQQQIFVRKLINIVRAYFRGNNAHSSLRAKSHG